MKKTLASLLLGCAVAAPAFAAVEEYTVDSNHTFPMFEVKHLNFSTQRGRFNKTSGLIALDREAKTGSINLLIDTTTLDMGFDTWDQHMSGEDWFDTANYPTMSFQSRSLKFEGDQLVGADGVLTIRGVDRPVHLKVENFRCGRHPMLPKDMCGADVSTTIKRSDFGMSKAIPAVSDEVKIYAPVEAFKN